MPFCALWRPFLHLCCCFFLGLYIPIFAILALLSFLLQFLSFKSLSICHLFNFSFPFLPVYVPFSLFRLLFLSLFFIFPFSPSLFFFFPSSLSSSFLLPLFDAPFGHFLAPPCGHPGCKRTLCNPQDTPLSSYWPVTGPLPQCLLGIPLLCWTISVFLLGLFL